MRGVVWAVLCVVGITSGVTPVAGWLGLLLLAAAAGGTSRPLRRRPQERENEQLIRV
ncbi:hypothetical protein [Amycolatopsis plumensis]|uniref:MYXO-CTERM domain-containing protein n=1 Tax=Amycolatopsis plumensis TaxID=236508 RepID=A0ABV5UFU8_9PSEU